MAQVEPMDIDGMESDYEDKENSIAHSNVQPKIPCTEKGYEELDVSEISMKLRYSITPASSPMSRSYTANCNDSKRIEDKNNTFNIGNDLTSSLNSTLTNIDINRAGKVYPLQTLSDDSLNESNRNVLISKTLDNEENNITITVSDNIDENLSIPSTSSSIPHTPEATTPTKELPKDGGSPIMRGLRSVLSMFKPQSPQPSHEQSLCVESDTSQVNRTVIKLSEVQPVHVSTPLRSTNRNSPKRTSPLKDSLVFNNDLEKELQWKDDSTIFFKEEKIPKRKLLLQESVASNLETKILSSTKEERNKTLEYMDISYNDTLINDKTMTDVEAKPHAVLEAGGLDSDGEFLDCETTYNKNEIEFLLKSKDNISVHSIHHISISKDNTSDFSKEIDSLNLPLSRKSLEATSNDEANSELAKDISENDNFKSYNILQETFSLTHSKDSSLCKAKMQDNSEISICDTIVSKSSAPNTEVNKVNMMEVGNVLNMTNSVQSNDKEIKHITLLTHENETYNCVHNDENQLECNSICIIKTNDTKSFIPHNENDLKTEAKDINNINNTGNFDRIDEDTESKEAACTNTQLDKQIRCNTFNEEAVKFVNLEGCDLNMKNKISEESNKEIKNNNESLLQSSINNNSNKTLEFDHKITIENCKKMLTQCDNVQIKENYSTNIENELHDASIVLSHSELNKKLPVDIPLPTDFDSDKDITDICKANKIHGDKELEANEVIESSKINPSKDLDKWSNVMETMQVENIVEKTIDNLSDSVNYNCKIPSDKIHEVNEVIQRTKINANKDLDKLSNVMETTPIENIYDKTIDNLSASVNCDRKITGDKEYVINEVIESFIINANNDLDKLSNVMETTPTENIYDKTIDNMSDSVNYDCEIPGYTEHEVNEVVESSNINANKDLNDLSNVIETTLNKTIDKLSASVNYDSKLKFENVEKCENHVVTCINTLNKDNSYENIEMNQEINKSVFTKNDDKKNNINYDQIVNSPDKNVINEIHETFSNESSQTSNACKTIELYTSEILKKEFSLQFDTDKNIEKLDDEVCSNEKQYSDPFETKNKLQISPPPSPLACNKGYNIDFDDIVDPFATKTKIRQSPTPEILGQVSLTTEDNKTRKSPKLNKSSKIRKPMNTKKNSLNATFDSDIKKDYKQNNENNCDTTVVHTTNDVDRNCIASIENNSVTKLDKEVENETINITDKKNEAIEDKHLFSEPANPSPVRDMTKSVFNCPEINDINFCSFSDTQKTMSSDLMMPTEDINIDSEDCLQLNIKSLKSVSTEAINDQQISNVDSETSIQTDLKSSIVKEVNTEDEDTATFNETTEFVENDKENASSVKDMLAFEVSHSALDSDNVDNGEMFIDAEAFELYLNQNKSNVIADSGKESLFLKFDPLFTKRVSSDGIIAALKRVQNNQSTPKKLTKLQLETASEMPGPSQNETLDEVVDEASIQAMSKPMMVVNPAINSIVSPRKVVTPKVNRQSLTFTSPAIAVIDKLLSLSGNSLINEHNTPESSPARQHNETDIAITQLREMLADKDIHVHNLRSESKELKERLSSLEEQVNSLEVESAERLKKVNDLSERLLEKTKMSKSMANVVEEYEWTIASLIAQIEQEKKNNAEERMILIKERDEQTAHLASMEGSFNDLHSKYEKSKQLIYSMKSNEETYTKSIKEFEESLAKMQNNYELLKQHATSKLNHANLELEKFNRAHEAELLKLNALIKRKEIRITGLEETLAQKIKANEELTAICDELINKVG